MLQKPPRLKAGDTVAAVEAFGLADRMDYLSTGGGAFLDTRSGLLYQTADGWKGTFAP